MHGSKKTYATMKTKDGHEKACQDFVCDSIQVLAFLPTALPRSISCSVIGRSYHLVFPFCVWIVRPMMRNSRGMWSMDACPSWRQI